VISLSLLAKLENIAYEKLLYSYRIRNKIVHNADNDTTLTIKYYAAFIGSISGMAVTDYIAKRDKNDFLNTDDILNNITYEYDKLKIELGESGIKALLGNAD